MNTIEESQQRLLALPVPDSANSKEWQRLILLASPSLIQSLDNSIGDGSSGHDKLIMIATCNGVGHFQKTIGKGGRFKPSASRFIHHAIATIDLVLQAKGPWDGENSQYYLEQVRYSYSQMKREYGSKSGPLSKREKNKARTLTLGKALNLRLREREVDFFAQNYAAVEPYLDLIIQRADMSGDQVKALIETRPEPALAAGAL